MYILGAPIGKDRAAYLCTVTKRFGTLPDGASPPGEERGVDYLNRVLDRQINKARGLLTYNALLLTAINTWPRPNTGSGEPWPYAEAVVWQRRLVVFSCVLLLILFRMGWGRSSEEYSSPAKDFAATFNTLVNRTHWLSIALYSSLFATGIMFFTSML